MRLANYSSFFLEGYAELAAPVTVPGSQTARFTWTVAVHWQTSFNTLKQAPFSASVLHRFGPAFHTVLNTDASNLAVAANLTQPDDKGRQNPISYECNKP